VLHAGSLCAFDDVVDTALACIRRYQRQMAMRIDE
jgi:hypothetical protein